MRVQVNLISSMDAVPVGVYLVRFEDVELVQPKEEFNAKGKKKYPYLNYTIIINDGPYREYKMRTIVSLSPDAAFMTKDFLRAMGEPVADNQKEFEFDPIAHIGKVVPAFLGLSEYNGKPQNYVQEYCPTPDRAKALVDGYKEEREANAPWSEEDEETSKAEEKKEKVKK